MALLFPPKSRLVQCTSQGNLVLLSANQSQYPKWSNSFITISYLLPEDGLGLTTETLLFPVVTSSALSVATLLGFLVLRYLVQLVHLALFAESATLFWYIHLKITHK